MDRKEAKQYLRDALIGDVPLPKFPLMSQDLVSAFELAISDMETLALLRKVIESQISELSNSYDLMIRDDPEYEEGLSAIIHDTSLVDGLLNLITDPSALRAEAKRLGIEVKDCV